MMQKSHSFLRALPMAAAMALAVSVSGQAAEQAGIAAAVVGAVDVTRQEADQSMSAKSGMDMFLQDRVETGEGARMQILLLDETVFTVGANSDLSIDEFVYDPSADAASLTASYSKGVFRYVSGKVGNLKPESVSIKLPSATIGIRGTSLFVTEDITTESPDDVFVGLLGPGRRNDSALTPGGMTVSNDNGKSDVVKGGYGVRVEAGKAPSRPMRTPPALSRRAMTFLDRAAPPDLVIGSGSPSGERMRVRRKTGERKAASWERTPTNTIYKVVESNKAGSEDTFGEEAASSSPGVAPDPRTMNDSPVDGVDNDENGHTQTCCHSF